MSAAGAEPRWSRFAERGSLFALRLARALYRLLGRRATRLLLAPIAAYFYVTGPRSRRASRDFLRAAWAHPEGRRAFRHRPGGADVFRHMHEFAVQIFDRAVVRVDDLSRIDFRHRGSEHLFRLAREGRGGILLGSHLGSFDMMRLLAGSHGLVVNVLMFTDQSERITRFLREIDPRSRVRVISLDPTSARTAFEIRACLARGEFVGILGDRVELQERDRAVSLPFFGRPAPFSLRPFLLAAVLGAPLLSAFCVREGEDAYRAEVELLFEGAPVPRRERRAQAISLLETWVRSLEARALAAPHQWFNFFDYWEGAAPLAQPLAREARAT